MLEDGTVLEGRRLRRGIGTAVGELVFITSMTGYQEIVTDPSFAGQLITFTQPMIGNYGVEADASESARPHARAMIVREGRNATPAGRAGFSDWLAEHGVVGIQGLDTRMLTRRLRDGGTVRGAVSSGSASVAEVLAIVRAAPEMAGQALAGQVSCARPSSCRRWRQSGPTSRCSTTASRGRSCGSCASRAPASPCFPGTRRPSRCWQPSPTACCWATAPATRPRCRSAWRRCAELVGQVPVFGICLGHQLLGRALGLETFKLRFGHRGANHPVLDVDTGRVLVTAQNHGFAVRVPDGGGDLETDFGPARVTHVSLYDGTVEGLELRELPVSAMQFHPEASPGPHDAREALEAFVERVAIVEVVRG